MNVLNLRVLTLIVITNQCFVMRAEKLIVCINALIENSAPECAVAHSSDEEFVVGTRRRADQRDSAANHVTLNVEVPILDHHGHLTEESAKILLVQAYQDGKISNLAFQDIHCLTVTDIKQAHQGNFTEQLFLVESTCGNPGDGSFILKGIGEADEIEALVKGSHHKDFAPLIYPNIQEGYPQMVFPVAYFSYKDQRGKIRALSLMNVASGQKVLALMETFAHTASAQERESMHRTVSEAYFQLGAQMARFYRRYARSGANLIPMGIRHGDLHLGNVFYDANTKQITLIDNNRIAKTIGRPESVWRDFVPLLANRNPQVAMEPEVRDEWFALSAPSFMVGFLSAYPASDRVKIFEEIEKSISIYEHNEDKKIRYQKGVVYQALQAIGKSVRTYLYEGDILKRVKKSLAKRPLVAEDVGVNAKNEKGTTALHDAVAHEGLVLWPLIAAGANVNARDRTGNTPLHDAARSNNADAIEILLAAGADRNARDRKGQTPLDVAVNTKSKDAAAALRGYGGKK